MYIQCIVHITSLILYKIDTRCIYVYIDVLIFFIIRDKIIKYKYQYFHIKKKLPGVSEGGGAKFLFSLLLKIRLSNIKYNILILIKGVGGGGELETNYQKSI